MFVHDSVRKVQKEDLPGNTGGDLQGRIAVVIQTVVPVCQGVFRKCPAAGDCIGNFSGVAVGSGTFKGKFQAVNIPA